MTTISSQRYTDDTIVAAKLADRDFVVSVSPVFVVDGRDLRAVMDGHHSLAAARIAGVEPSYVELSVRDADTIALLTSDIEDFLAAISMDTDWYDIETGYNVW